MSPSRRKLLVGLSGAAGAAALGIGATRSRTVSPTLSPAPASGPARRWEPGWHAGFNHAHVHNPVSGYGSQSSKVELRRLRALGATHVFLTPFAYQPDLDAPYLRFGASMDGTLTDEHLLQEAEQARAIGLQVAMKPHVWSNAFWSSGKSRQDIAMRSDQDWLTWFEHFGAFAEHYASLAERMGCALMCVGLEYLAATRARPGAWAEVAERCRGVFQGSLTYAANWWEEAEAFTDWAAFDVVGVNAYYPLSDAENPDVEELLAGWQPHVEALGALASRTGKPIVLTEAGLRTVQGAAAKPWDHGLSGPDDPMLQARAYEALLQAFTPHDWFAGVYWWKSFTRAKNNARDAYAPLGKPAGDVLTRWWTQA